jgi:hypothetical protein
MEPIGIMGREANRWGRRAVWRGGKVFDMLGQIGLLQVDEGHAYKDFISLVAAAWTIEPVF